MSGEWTFVLVALLYFAPVIIASLRGNRHADGVGVVNLFLGWTFVGWVVALAWAVSGPTAREAKQRTASANGTADEHNPSAAAEIERLLALREKGEISAEQYDALKARIIADGLDSDCTPVSKP